MRGLCVFMFPHRRQLPVSAKHSPGLSIVRIRDTQPSLVYIARPQIDSLAENSVPLPAGGSVGEFQTGFRDVQGLGFRGKFGSRKFWFS